mmetsp:Transcript_158909/g.293133  ORF Transcript_158909/g.293133 Transcript_158909/m.293133 type:complete len:174 (+) Transcript_158909:128-649(+)
MGQVPARLPECACLNQDCDLSNEQQLVEVNVRPVLDWSDMVEPSAERKDIVLRCPRTSVQGKPSSSNAGKKDVVTQIDISRAQQSSSESTATARSTESDLTERTLSEWYSEKSEGDFVEVAPENLKIAGEDDRENFMKFKSLSKWLADGRPQPSCESDTTENYFVHDPSAPDS